MGRSIFAILAVVLAGAIFFLYTKPAYDSVQATQGQIATYNTELDEVGQLQSLAQTLNTQYSSISPDNLNRLQVLLPDQVDNIALILDLSNMATKYGMPLENVQVQTPDSSDPSDSANAASSGAITAASSQNYNTLSLTFTTVGTYQDFISLMTDLESSLRVVDLQSLTITASTGTGAQGASVYQYNITIQTYWLKQ